MKKILVLINLCLPLLIFPSLRDSLNIRLVGAWPYDKARDVYPISHDIVYLGVGHGIWIYNTTNPQNPVKIGEIPFIEGYCISEIVRKDNFLYIVHKWEGFSILDITNPLQPQRISYVELMMIQDIYIEGNYAYILGDTFFIYDISNPINPVRISATPLINAGGWWWNRHLFVFQNHAYLGIASVGILVYDISNPSRPREIGRWNVSVYEEITDIWVRDTFLYVPISVELRRASLKILSISNPANIYQIGEWIFTDPYKYTGGMAIKDNFAYITRLPNGLDIIDITNPRSPSFVSNAPILCAEDIVILDSMAYLVSTALAIVNIRDPYHPRVLCDSLFTPAWILGMETKDNFAFLACGMGMTVIDFSNLSNPIDISYLNFDVSWCYDVAIKDSFAYTSKMWWDTLKIINIANPSSINVINSLRFSYARALFIRDTFLYMAHAAQSEWTIGFSVWNISNPTSPVLLGSVENEDADAYGLFVKDSFAYVGDGPWDRGEEYGGFRIYNVANPYSPYQVYHFVPNFISSGGTNGIYVKDTIAFVCDDAALFIFNVKNPNNPTLLTYYQEYKPSDILVTENNIAYLADGYFGIRVLDVSDIYHIQQLGYYKISGYVSTLRVRGNYILAALDHGGFYVFEYYGVPIKEDTINIKSLKSDNFKVDIKRKKLFLAIRLSKEENLQLDIINNLGRIITTTELGKMKEGMNYIYLELPHIPSGIYFIRLKKENEIIFRKFFFIRN